MQKNVKEFLQRTGRKIFKKAGKWDDKKIVAPMMGRLGCSLADRL